MIVKLADCTEWAIAREFASKNDGHLAYCWSTGLWYNIESIRADRYWRPASKSRVTREIGSLCQERARELEPDAVAEGFAHLILQIASGVTVANIERLLRSDELLEYETPQELTQITGIEVFAEPAS